MVPTSPRSQSTIGRAIENLPIFWKLLIPLGLVVVLGIGSSLSGLLGLRKSQQLFDHLYDRHIHTEVLLGRLVTRFIEHEIHLDLHLIRQDPAEMQQQDRALVRLEAAALGAVRDVLADLRRGHPVVVEQHEHQHPQLEPVNLRELMRQTSEYVDLSRRVRKLSGSGQKQQARELMYSHVQPLLLRLTTEVNRALSVEQTHVQLFYKHAGRLQRQVVLVSTTIFGLVAALALLTVFVVARMVARRAGALAQRAQQLGQGDLTTRLPPGSHDELGRVGDVLNETSVRLETLINEIEQQRDALHLSNVRLQGILDNSSACIFIKDRDGRYLLANRRYAQLLNLTADEIAGKTDHELLPHDQASARQASERQVLESQRSINVEEVFARPGGETPATFLTVKFPIRDGRGEAYGTCGIATDITERKVVDRMKSEFVSVVSHELRTPLTAIRGSLGLLEGGVVGELGDKAKGMVAIARDHSDRLIRMINDILDLEKLEAGKVQLRPESLRVDEIVQPTLEVLEPVAQAAEVRLVAEDHGDESLRLDGDRDRLIQVMTNLVGNAIKFSPAGGTVTVRWAAEGADRVRVAVLDQGPGIPEKMRTRLFTKFDQLSSSEARRKGGSGLGLAISRAIIEQHGGVIGASGEEGAGATFFFLLRRAHLSYEI